MLGKLLKELMLALWRFVKFRVMGPRGNPQATDASGIPTESAPAPYPQVQEGGPLRSAPPAVAATAYQPAGSFDWQVLGRQSGTVYLGGPPPAALDLLINEPRFILDVGCGGGDFAARAKQRFPRARVWGVEPTEAAARMAAPRIDRVICQSIERINWKGEGVQRGDIDTVFLFDVLEHTYDPWSTLLGLRNLICDSAQVLVSIPNVRNILLMQDLISGFWRYRRTGLLDITHIRFFTRDDLYRMFYQTGFRVVKSGFTLCDASAEIYEKHRSGQYPQTIELESASITVHSAADLSSLCALQHQFTLQPADYNRLSADERQWIDAPHPPSRAYSSD